MNGGAIYNEIEPYAAEWLENLVARGLIAPGRVERRSVADLTAADVAGPGQRHFFAGIGGWSHALRLAGVPDDADVWTGSCPCQGLSDAGKRLGTRDPRHLWPAWFELIRECRPAIVLGEQVASKLGLAWLDLVRADLEGCGYAFGASNLGAASVGAPHIRQRLYFVADRHNCDVGQWLHVSQRQPRRAVPDAPRRGEARELADIEGDGWQERRGSRGEERTGPLDDRTPVAHDDTSCSRGGGHTGAVHEPKAQGEGERREPRRVPDVAVDAGTDDGTMGDSDGVLVAGSTECGVLAETQAAGPSRIDRDHRTEHAGAAHLSDFWRDVEWLPCTDGKARPVEPGLVPLAHGVSGRVAVRRAVESAESEVQETHWYNRAGALVGFGNAIVPQIAAAFIEAAIVAIGDD